MNTQIKRIHREGKERGRFKFALMCYFHWTGCLKTQSLNQYQSETLKGVH